MEQPYLRPPSASNSRSAAASILISDRSYQLSAIRTINSFLSSHSAPFSLKPPLPSAKDKYIVETLKFTLSVLHFSPSNKLDEDLFTVLKNKSAVKTPGTPHSWPSLLAVIHWLVQTAMYNDHLSNSTRTRLNFEGNSVFVYALRSYLRFIRGDDDAVENEDSGFLEKLQRERDLMEENVNGLVRNVKELEGKVESLKTEPLEKEKSVSEEDVKKFHTIIEQLDGHIVNVEVLEEKEKELEAKVVERKRICEENEELKNRVEEQAFNARDAERMKRELQAVERDIGEAEAVSNTWEEKSWDLDEGIGKKFKEVQNLMIERNQAIRKFVYAFLTICCFIVMHFTP